jgi:ornithine cyclodeaminase/alanine dehydrogenase-like protein (mu-crystallin family)
MPLTVLTDHDVKDLLHTLTKPDLLEIQANLAEALHSYSTGDTNSPCCSSFQPQRTVIKKKGITTLFMPASTGTGVGMKIVSLETPEKKENISADGRGSVSSASTGTGASIKEKGRVGTDSSIKSQGRVPTGEMGQLNLTPASTMSSADSVSGASFAPPASIASSQSTAPKGTVTMLDPLGNPVGILNAEELTAFRTALASTLMFQKRENVNTITVFGAGRQAYWHIRLSLIFKPDQIKHVNIINRSFERSIRLMKSFQIDEGKEGLWRKDIKFSALSPEFGEYGRLLKEEVRKADVIYCCTPSLDPLFPAEFLTSREGQRKGRYVSGIGSYAPHMTELHPDIFKMAVSNEHHHHHHKHAKTSGVVIVDTLEGCLKEAGEIIQAKLKPEHLVEIGELMMIKKAAHKEIELGGEGEKGLLEWLTRGNVVYKGVGLGLMDLTVGDDLIRLAREREIGVTVPDF